MGQGGGVQGTGARLFSKALANCGLNLKAMTFLMDHNISQQLRFLFIQKNESIVSDFCSLNLDSPAHRPNTS